MEFLTLSLPEASYLWVGLAVQSLLRNSSLRFVPAAIVLIWVIVLLGRTSLHGGRGYGNVLGYVATSLIIIILFWSEATIFGRSGVVVGPENVSSYAAVADGGDIQTAAETRDVPIRLLDPVGIPPGFRLLLRAITETPLALARAISSTAHRPFSALMPMQTFINLGLPADLAGGLGDWTQGCYTPAMATFRSSPGGSTYQELLPWSDLMQIELSQRTVFPGSQTASQWVTNLFVPTQPVTCTGYLKTLELQIQKWLFTQTTEKGTALRDLFASELGLNVEDQARFLAYKEIVRAAGPDVPAPSLVGAYAGLRAAQVATSAAGGMAGQSKLTGGDGGPMLKAGGILGAIGGLGNELHRAIDGASWVIGLSIWLTWYGPYIAAIMTLVMTSLFPFVVLLALTPGQQGQPLVHYFTALLITSSLPLCYALIDVVQKIGMQQTGSGMLANISQVMAGWVWSATLVSIGIILIPIVMGITLFASFRTINGLWRGGA